MTRPHREKRRVTAAVSSQDPKPQIRIPARQNPDRPSLEAFQQLEAVTMSAEEGASDAKPTENGPLDRDSLPELTHDRLVQLVVELKLQNEVLKSQFKDSKDFEQRIREEKQAASDATVAPSDVEQELRGSIESLSRELQEQTQRRGAAEQALQHLREVHAEADARAQELSLKLSEARQKLDKEIKDREEKYSELDSKFQRLHKRAKQRIQEVQKEKDDLEVKFRDVNDSAERASSQLSALQQELDRTRQQANEALKAMDAERQQLRSANNKLRDNIEDLRRSFEPKENALNTLQQILLEKDQMLEDMRGLLNSAEEKRQASLAEVSVKHQKNIENLEVQLSDALMDRSKATETISSLQTLIAEKDSRIAELDAASTGKAARLSAALESLKGELAHQKDEHEKEKEQWESAFQGLKMKLEVAESNCIRAEIEAAKMKSQLEMEVSSRSQMFNKKEAELLSAKEEISRLESEFSSYKFRAHSLLQKKDAEIAASKDSEQVKALEEALKEVENELAVASAERDKTLQDLQYRKVNYEKQLADRDEALNMAKQQLRNMEMKLDSTITAHLSEKSSWDINLQNLEESWHLRFEALKAETKASSGQDIQREYDDLKLKHKKLTEESDSLRVLADKMVEGKDKEISRLLDDNKKLRHTLELRQQAYQNDKVSTTFQNRDAHSSSSIAEQQILILARQQAQREEQLAQSQRHILALQEEIADLERENRLHSQQEAMLKTELRDMERKQKREGVDMTYLKNVVLKLLETGEVEALLPVVATLLQFSPQEVVKCQQAYRANNEVQTTPGSESSASSPLSLFSRFSFS